MNVKTGGERRGLIARWVFRFEASSMIFRIVFLGITAASTLTSALVAVGYGHFAPPLLATGVVVSPVFAWLYVRHIHNRKNRERADLGDNYSGPTMYMDRSIDADQRAYIAWLMDPEDRALEVHQKKMQELTAGRWGQYRTGISEEDIKT